MKNFKERLRRRKVIVKRSLQLKYALIILAAVLVTAMTVGIDLYFSLHGFMREYLSGLPHYEQLMSNVNQLMYAKVVVLLVISVAVSFLISHKFAGPIYRLEKSLKKIAAGDLTGELSLRKGDELKGLAEYFNNTVSQLHSRAARDRNRAQRSVEKIDELIKKGNFSKKETEENLKKIKDEMEAIASDWKIED